MIKALVLSAMMALNIGYDYSENGNEQVICTVESLDDHGFVQFGEWQEYVCVNVKDETDFIVVEDRYDEMRIGDVVWLELNKYDEVMDYEVLVMID